MRPWYDVYAAVQTVLHAVQNFKLLMHYEDVGTPPLYSYLPHSNKKKDNGLPSTI